MFKSILHTLGVPTTMAEFIADKVTVAHFVEGRARVICKQLGTDDELYEQVERELQNVRELDSFSINRTTGSVILNYQPHNIPETGFIRELIDLVRARYKKEHHHG